MNTYFHGTTAKNFEILKAKKNEPVSVWNVSDRDRYLYLWDLEKNLNKWDGGVDQTRQIMIRQAFESAALHLLLDDSNCDLFVLELRLDPNEVEDDLSCENMAASCSCIGSSGFDIDDVVAVYRLSFNKWYLPFVLSGVLENKFFNGWMFEESPLGKIAEAITNSKIYMDELYEIYDEWEVVSSKNRVTV